MDKGREERDEGVYIGRELKKGPLEAYVGNNTVEASKIDMYIKAFYMKSPNKGWRQSTYWPSVCIESLIFQMKIPVLGLSLAN